MTAVCSRADATMNGVKRLHKKTIKSATRKRELPTRTRSLAQQCAPNLRERRVGPVLRGEEVRGGCRRVAVVAVVALRVVREAEAGLMAELVRRGRAEAAAEPVDELRSRFRLARVDALAAHGHHLHPIEHVEPHAARRRRRIREAGGIEPRTVGCVLDRDPPIAGAALSESNVETLERAIEGRERRLSDPRLL